MEIRRTIGLLGYGVRAGSDLPVVHLLLEATGHGDAATASRLHIIAARAWHGCPLTGRRVGLPC